jgi:hypothetical protein
MYVTHAHAHTHTHSHVHTDAQPVGTCYFNLSGSQPDSACWSSTSSPAHCTASNKCSTSGGQYWQATFNQCQKQTSGVMWFGNCPT